MKNLKETVDAKTKGTEWTNELIAKEIGMSRVGFYQALEKNSLKLEKLVKLFDLFNIEPNDFFNWNVEKSNVAVFEPASEYRLMQNESKSVSGSEVEFLRGQVEFLNTQIDRLSETINNLTAK